MKVNTKNNEASALTVDGLSETGRNTYGVQFQDEIIIIDAGIKFPEDNLFGTDYVIPDYSYIAQGLHKVKALVITRGHEDHIGGVPHLLCQANIPVYAGLLALALITNKLDEYGLLRGVELYKVNEDTVIRFRKVAISFFWTIHSIPDVLGIVVKMPSGNIVVTDDLKFNLTPVGEPANLHRMVRLGEKGISYLLSDGTNAEIPTFIRPEETIGTSILKTFEKIDGRIIFASFASNISRLQQTANIAVKAGRKITAFSRSIKNTIANGERLGYIKIPKGALVDTTELNQLLANETTILCTSSQGEPTVALSRIANGTHRQISIQPGDTAVLLGLPAPGNMTSVSRLISSLSETGAEVIHGETNNIHTSGHGGQEEQELMLRLMKLKYFMPVHGESRMLKIHASLVQDTGVPEKNYFIMGNGDVLTLAADSARPAGHFNANDVYVDGDDVGDTGNVVLRGRRILSKEDLALAVATADIRSKKVMASPDIPSHSLIYMRESGNMIHKDQRLLFNALREAARNKNCTEVKLGEAITTTLQSLLFEQTERHPMILSMIMIATVSD